MKKRNLFLTNITPEEALKRLFAALCLRPAVETIDVTGSLGRITAHAVIACCCSPLYDSAAMDGIAVVSAQTNGASESRPLDLKPGTDYITVDTGDPVRPPYDAVIMAEELHENDDGTVRIRAAAVPWAHVRPVGEDIVQGEMILPGGSRIRPVDIGAMLSAGVTRIDVLQKPAVAILPTGTELVEPGTDTREGDIIESNAYMLSALVTESGGASDRYSPIPDDREALKTAIQDAVSKHDMTLIIAGSSAGTEDYTVHVLRELGEVLVHGVATKPGKPVIIAAVDGKPVIGLPGYPVSAYLAYTLFAAPVLERLSGRTGEAMTVCKAVLTRRLVSSLKHREYVRVKVGRVGSRLVASPLSRGAGAAMSLVRADGFCVIPQNVEGLEAGSEAAVHLTRPLPALDKTLVCIGSHDLMLDILAERMPGFLPGTALSSTHTGSMGGLMALARGEAHIAPLHLLDENTGAYNIPYIKQILADKAVLLIKGVGRVQGLIVPKGNPINMHGIEDLTRCRYINRQRGAGTRVLLDYKLKESGIASECIKGYDREAATHTAVAAAIKSGSADTGMGIYAAAQAMDLDFIPLWNEEYDFALPEEYLELPQLQAFLCVLRSEAFKARLAEMGGYTTAHSGEVIRLG